MSGATDETSPLFRAAFRIWSDAVTYQAMTLQAFGRGLGAQDNWAGAIEGDFVIVIDAAAFAAAFPSRPAPQRMDKVTMGGSQFTVQEHRASPAAPASPTFFKCRVRGGSQ